MRILVDIDGVLADQVEAALPVINARYGLELTREDIKEYDQVVLPWDDEEGETIGTELAPLMHSRAFVAGMRRISGAADSLESLAWPFDEYGRYDVSIVTSRPEEARQATRMWLWQMRFIYHGDLVFTDDKASLDGDILIDDAPHHILAWAATGRLAIVFDQPWNREVADTDFIKRAVGWDEVVRIVREVSDG